LKARPFYTQKSLPRTVQEGINLVTHLYVENPSPPLTLKDWKVLRLREKKK